MLREELTDRQRRTAELAAELAARFAPQVDADDRQGRFPMENYQALHDAGYLRLVIPAEYGGEGADVLEMVLAQERLATGDGATALAVGMLVQLLGRLAEDRPWPEPVFGQVCRTIAAEGGLINSVVTEAAMGSVSRGSLPSTTATPVPGGYMVCGHKIFATGGPALRYMATGVVIPPSGGVHQAETATAIIDTHTSGVLVQQTGGESLGMRTSGNDDVVFEDVFVPEDYVVDRRVVGVAAPGRLSGWSLAIAAVYLGVGQAACNAACGYANTRTPPSLGKPIATLPHIQQWVGDIQSRLDACRALLYSTARAWSAHPEQRDALAAQIASAKYLCTNTACEVTDLALRVAGGFGTTRALPLERLLRDARAGLFHPLQDDLALALIGRATLASR